MKTWEQLSQADKAFWWNDQITAAFHQMLLNELRVARNVHEDGEQDEVSTLARQRGEIRALKRVIRKIEGARDAAKEEERTEEDGED